ncbi:MAG: hypothetical protein GX549_09205, partial [Clostridiales bacterium]|nr:hypothetical protein [Clostridiales bacterium]
MSVRRIEEIDSNLKVETTLAEKDIVFCDVRQSPFGVYGLYDYRSEPVFKRMPGDVAEATNEGVKNLHLHTAGGRA